MQNKNTHIIFDGKKIFVSPNLMSIVNFLGDIEKEIEDVLGCNKKLWGLGKQYAENLKLIQVLFQKLKDNSIEFEFTISENPVITAKKFVGISSTRSEMVFIFAYLETLLRLEFAYKKKINDGKEIRKLTLNKKVWESFYNDFCLNQNNKWIQENKERAKNITAEDLRYLRNSLTHFLSVDRGLQISDSILKNESRKLEKLSEFKVKFISPEDLYQIAKNVTILIIEKWNKDCQECLKINSNDFREKILCVSKLIEESGAVIIRNGQLNLKNV